MKEILGAAAPYGMIKDAESLIGTLEGIDTALVQARREQVLRDIDVQIGKVQVELDDAKAAADLRNQCLQPLQSLRRQVETQPSIAHIDQARQTAIEATDVAFEKIEAASRQQDKGGLGEKPPPIYVKKGRVVEAARLAPKSFLETQADVDDYLNKLREELESAIKNNERIEIR